jgi:hypothetical protein
MLAILALGQTRNIPLVKGTPTNYDAYGFDISWVDSTTQQYYLADRTNNAIDLVEAAADIFMGLIGKGHYKLLISSRLARGISLKRMHVPGNTVGCASLHDFQVVSGLQVQPESRRSLEVARQA